MPCIFRAHGFHMSRSAHARVRRQLIIFVYVRIGCLCFLISQIRLCGTWSSFNILNHDNNCLNQVVTMAVTCHCVCASQATAVTIHLNHTAQTHSTQGDFAKSLHNIGMKRQCNCTRQQRSTLHLHTKNCAGPASGPALEVRGHASPPAAENRQISSPASVPHKEDEFVFTCHQPGQHTTGTHNSKIR